MKILKSLKTKGLVALVLVAVIAFAALVIHFMSQVL